VDVGSGGGTVKLDGVTMPCSPYTLDVSEGTRIIVEAVPDFGHVFDGWSGDLNTAESIAIILVDCNKDITASFSIDWMLFGFTSGCLILAILLASVLIIRRRDSQDEQSVPENPD